MKHDYENARRGAVIRNASKTRVTLYLDDDVLAHFIATASSKGRGCQGEINQALRNAMGGQDTCQGSRDTSA